MPFWNDGIRTRNRSRSRSRSSSRERRHSRSNSQASSKHYTSRPSFARSVSSFLGGGGGGSQSGGNPRAGSTSGHTARGRSSYTSARPRSGFVARVRKFLRQLYDYMRRHPFKVFFLVIMPLITGGVLTKLLATVGVRMPRGLEQMVGSNMNRGVSESQRYYARGGARDFGGGSALPGIGGAVGAGAGGMNIGQGVQTALNIAKMFM